jgi:hypothetical protein
MPVIGRRTVTAESTLAVETYPALAALMLPTEH